MAITQGCWACSTSPPSGNQVDGLPLDGAKHVPPGQWQQPDGAKQSPPGQRQLPDLFQVSGSRQISSRSATAVVNHANAIIDLLQ